MDIYKANNFQESLNNLKSGAKFQFLFNLLQSRTDQLCQDFSVSLFEEVKGTFKNGKYQLSKMARSCYLIILINLQKQPETSFQAPTLSQEYVRSVFHTAH